MSDTLTPLAPADVAARISAGHALLIDIREPDEFARRHVPGAVSLPLSRFDLKPLPVLPGTAVIFTCKTWMRTGANAARLAAPVAGDAFVLAGGVDAWAAAGAGGGDQNRGIATLNHHRVPSLGGEPTGSQPDLPTIEGDRLSLSLHVRLCPVVVRDHSRI